MILQGLLPKSNENKQMQYVQMMSGNTPIYSQFGQNVYASDIVQNCIDVIATEISKLLPRHIRTDSKTGVQTIPNGNLNRLFKFSPNPLMTMSDFLEKTLWQLLFNYNCFIYPVYQIVNGTKAYTAFYPLNPSLAEFVQDVSGALFVRLSFANSEQYTLPYSDIIHLRKKFSTDDIMGGGLNGQPDNSALLKALTINDNVLQGIEKGVKASMSVKLAMKINTLMDDDAKKAERAKFETQIANGESGIVVTDMMGDITPITVDPHLVDKDTLDFLQNKILNWFGVSVPILTGKYTDDEYQAFYEKTLEPILIKLGQAFSKCLFTQRELDTGNEVVFYQRDMMYLSTSAKLNILRVAGDQGLLSDDQKLAILGYSPLIDGTGSRRTQSLNYVDTTLASQYQLQGNQAATTATGTQQDDIVATVQETTGTILNGAQVQSLISVVQAVKDGTITKAAAVEIITSAFGMSKEKAEKILDDTL